jgi:hypothetical protein
MQPTTRLHHHITDTMPPDPTGFIDDATAFNPTNGVFDPNTQGGDAPVLGFLRIRQLLPTWFFLRLHDGDAWQREALKSCVLPQPTARWQCIPFHVSDPFIMDAARIGLTQKKNASIRRCQTQVLDTMPLFLSTICFFLLIGIKRPVYRSLGAVMKKSAGSVSAASVFGARLPAKYLANSSALRAGTASWSASAALSTAWSR